MTEEELANVSNTQLTDSVDDTVFAKNMSSVNLGDGTWVDNVRYNSEIYQQALTARPVVVYDPDDAGSGGGLNFGNFALFGGIGLGVVAIAVAVYFFVIRGKK